MPEPQFDQDDRAEVQCPECGHGASVYRMTFSGGSAAADEDAEAFGESIRESNRRRAIECPYPVYGLAAWDGRHTFAGSGESNGVVSSIKLGYGDMRTPGSPFVVVSTDRREYAAFAVARRLAHSFWHWTHEYSEALRSTYRDRDVAQWDDLTLPVDGTAVAWKALGATGCSVAMATHGGVTIGIETHGVDIESLRLVEVSDLGPFLLDDGR
jgi:hypothetical protein